MVWNSPPCITARRGLRLPVHTYALTQRNRIHRTVLEPLEKLLLSSTSWHPQATGGYSISYICRDRQDRECLCLRQKNKPVGEVWIPQGRAHQQSSYNYMPLSSLNAASYGKSRRGFKLQVAEPSQHSVDILYLAATCWPQLFDFAFHFFISPLHFFPLLFGLLKLTQGHFNLAFLALGIWELCC